MLNIFKTYLIQFLVGVNVLQLASNSLFYFQKNKLKNELKTQKHQVLELKTQILLLKKNCKTEVENSINMADTNRTIEEIIKLQEVDSSEEVNQCNHANNSSDILHGMFLMQSTD